MMSPIKENFQTVLFDLDGTLIDHFQAIYRCYVYAQEQMNLPITTYEKVRATVGGSVQITMARLIGEEKAPEAVAHFRKHFDEIMLEDLIPLPGSLEILRELYTQGKQLAVFTNKQGDASRKICEHLGYTQYLERVIGTGDTDYRKPEIEFTQYVLNELNAQPEDSIMIGDSPFDVGAAKCVQMHCYCVGTGSHSVEALRANEPIAPDAVYADMVALGQEAFQLPAYFADSTNTR